MNGNLLAVLLYISAPLIVLNLFTYVYGIIDMVVVADKGGDVLSAVVMANQLQNLFTTLGGGLATGGSIMVSRFIGRNDYPSAKSAANTFLTVAAVISLAFVGIILPFTDPLLRAAQFDDRLLAVGRSYFAVQVITAGVGIFNSTFLSFEKSRGATTNVLFINLVVMAVKIALTLLFVQAYDLDVVWIALSTLFANLIITSYAAVNLIRRKYLFAYSFKNNRFKADILKPYVRLSMPVFLGKFVFSFGKVIVNALGTQYNRFAPGALGVSNNVAGAVTNVTSATEEAISTVVSQNIGARNNRRALKCFWVALALDIAIALIGTFILNFISGWLAGFFSQGGDVTAEEAEYQRRLIEEIFRYELVGIPFLGVNAASMGFIYGLGYTKLSLVFNLSRLFVLRLPVVMIMLFCFYDFGPGGLGLGMLVSNVGVGVVSFILALACYARVGKGDFRDDISGKTERGDTVSADRKAEATFLQPVEEDISENPQNMQHFKIKN